MRQEYFFLFMLSAIPRFQCQTVHLIAAMCVSLFEQFLFRVDPLCLPVRHLKQSHLIEKERTPLPFHVVFIPQADLPLHAVSRVKLLLYQILHTV